MRLIYADVLMCVRAIPNERVSPSTRYSDRLMASKRLFFVRMPCAVIGQLLLWIGMYDIFDLTIDRNPASQIYIDFAFIFSGLGMLVATNTLVWCANIYPDESVFDNDVTPDHTLCQHIKFTLKVIVSMLSQNCLWLGMYDLLENYYSGGTLGYVDAYTYYMCVCVCLCVCACARVCIYILVIPSTGSFFFLFFFFPTSGSNNLLLSNVC